MKYEKSVINLSLLFVFILSATVFSFDSKNLFSEKVRASLSDGSDGDAATLLNNGESEPENFNIEAESVLSVQEGKILFSKNEEKKLPIASLTKLMTALIVLEQYDLSAKVVVSDLAMQQEGEQGNLKSGEVLSVKDLLYIMLIESSNRAAFALSEIVGTDTFIHLMNLKSREMGLQNTNFSDSTGLSSSSYSTAADLAKLSEYLFKNYPLFREIIKIKEFDLYLDNGQFHHKLQNTNKLLGEVQSVVGGKTGWTNFSKGCFVIIQENPKNKNYLFHVILGSEDRFSEMTKLIDFINKNFSQ